MPPLKPVPGVARVNMLWSVGDDLDCATSVYFNYTGGSFSSGNAAAMAESITTASDFPPAGQMHPSRSFLGVRVTDLASDTGGDGTYTADIAGTRSGGPLPASAATVMAYTIDRRYRGGKPRGFLPWGTDTDLSDPQTWNQDWLTASLAQWQGMLSTINGTSAGGSTLTSHVSIGRYSGFTVVTSPTTGRARNVPTQLDSPNVYNVISTSASAHIGSQRRRNEA